MGLQHYGRQANLYLKIYQQAASDMLSLCLTLLFNGKLETIQLGTIKAVPVVVAIEMGLRLAGFVVDIKRKSP